MLLILVRALFDFHLEQLLQLLLLWILRQLRQERVDSAYTDITQQRFTYGIMIDFISYVNDINCGKLTKSSTVEKILALINEDMDLTIMSMLYCA